MTCSAAVNSPVVKVGVKFVQDEHFGGMDGRRKKGDQGLLATRERMDSPVHEVHYPCTLQSQFHVSRDLTAGEAGEPQR